MSNLHIIAVDKKLAEYLIHVFVILLVSLCQNLNKNG